MTTSAPTRRRSVFADVFLVVLAAIGAADIPPHTKAVIIVQSWVLVAIKKVTLLANETKNSALLTLPIA